VSNLVQMRAQIRNPALAATLLLRNQHILQSVRIITEESHENVVKERTNRPHSPVKMLTNLFGGAVSRDHGSLRKQHTSSPALTDIPQLHPTQPSRRRSDEASNRATSPAQLSYMAADDLTKLEETLASYILALQALKGNIVGKILRSRAISADEVEVNHLYNAVQEDPANYEIVAQAPIDVLFSAYEKFVKVAWFDKFGPIIPPSTWDAILSKLDGMYPGDFEEFFRAKVSEMSPQNQRALRACIQLLADLLAGTSNDSDRGVLTASFAEVLVSDGNPNEFVTVLDRLVEDIQALLEVPASTPRATPHGSISEGTRTRATNTGSLTSNTSLRKKFGFGTLTRKASKLQQSDDSEKTDLSSVWRALSKSKHGGGEGQNSTMSKASSLANIGRSNSTDINARGSPKRPVSRERPTVLGAFQFEQQSALTTIGEGQISGPPRKKRRSSISDLRSLQAEVSAHNTPTFIAPLTPNKRDNSRLVSESPRTPSPTKLSFIPAPSPAPGSPTQRNREGSPIRVLPRPQSLYQPSQPISSKPEEVTITSHNGTPRRHKESNSVSGIPIFKSPPGGLSERPTSGNVRKLPPNLSSPEKLPLGAAFAPTIPSAKLRMQSPQKLRERLQNEKKAIEDADATLQAELNRIGEEMKARGKGSHASPTKIGHSRGHSTAAPTTFSSPDAASFESQFTSLKSKQSAVLTSLTSRLDSLNSDITSSLQVSENRVKELDKLYREANAENEIVYAKFNEELEKVVQGVRAGKGEAELRRRMKEAEDEATRLRKENGRLKRENVGLRAQLKG
jgi:hypothetical protein